MHVASSIQRSFWEYILNFTSLGPSSRHWSNVRLKQLIFVTKRTNYLKARSREFFFHISMKMCIVWKVGGKKRRGACHAGARSSLRQTNVQETTIKGSLQTRRIRSCARKLKFEPTNTIDYIYTTKTETSNVTLYQLVLKCPKGSYIHAKSSVRGILQNAELPPNAKWLWILADL